MPSTESEIKAQIKEFISSNFFPGKSADGVKDDTSFLDAGIIDSTGVLELVGFIEEKFGFPVDDSEMLPENLDSLNNLTAYIVKKSGASKG
jgi:acyl carrier protein